MQGHDAAASDEPGGSRDKRDAPYRTVRRAIRHPIARAQRLDTFQAAHTLYVDTPAQQAVVASADAGALCQDKLDAAARRRCAMEEFTTLEAAGLPVGWPLSWPFADLPPGVSWVLKVLGMGHHLLRGLVRRAVLVRTAVEAQLAPDGGEASGRAKHPDGK